MEKMRLLYPISIMCRIFGVSMSGFHAWRKRAPSRRKQEDSRMEIEITAAHKRTRETYGAERLQHELANNGVVISIHRIKRLRKKLGLRCKQKRKFKATTDSRHTLPVADNLLHQRFETAAPNQVWVSDITYIPTKEGWLYLAGHRDIFTGAIVGYAMSSRMKRDLVERSLLQAVKFKKPGKGLIHHSDRGSQYCSRDYGILLDRFGIKASMSRKGNCYDNAPMESFWGTLKNELVYHRCFETRQQAMREITEYIEIFYNRQRRQKKLGFLAPYVYERQFYEKQLAA